MWKNLFVEGWNRTLVKMITWRVIVTLTNFVGGVLSSYLTTGHLLWSVGFGVAGFALVVNSLIYILHEQFWNKIGWQKKIAAPVR